MDCTVLDENGKSCHLQMGCYGIGITRVIASAIEQNFDKHGIIWPDAMAPFQIAICPMNGFKSMRLMEYANELYQALTEIGFKVLLDDRPIRPGPMLSDMELIGIPHRITLGERGLDKQEVEYRHRRASENEIVPQDQILTFIKQRITTPTQ
jgi:prolyl-tRNA synthetase